jgi:hypothetical protein
MYLSGVWLGAAPRTYTKKDKRKVEGAKTIQKPKLINTSQSPTLYYLEPFPMV